MMPEIIAPSGPDRAIRAILDDLASAEGGVLDVLRSSRARSNEALWKLAPELYRAFAKRLIDTGHPNRAFELVRDGLKDHKNDRALEYYGALALTRGGNVRQAAAYVEKLRAAPDLDRHPEVKSHALALAGRLLKAEYLRADARLEKEPDKRSRAALELARRKTQLARDAVALYLESYEASKAHAREGDPFPLINAATMSLLGDLPTEAYERAEEAIARANAELEDPKRRDDYWLFATLGEAHYILGGNAMARAEHWYREAVDAARARGDVGSVASMRVNLHLLREKVPIGDEVWRITHMGNAVAFAGHMIDHPDRVAVHGLPPRFPADKRLEDRVKRAIDEKLDELKAGVGYCSAACGSDLLFAELMLQRGAELHVVLPFDNADFFNTSVHFGDPALRAYWQDRCNRVLRKASEVHYATKEFYLGDDDLFGFVNTVTQGLSIIRAAERGVDAHALVVLDPASPPRPGGAAYFRDRWPAHLHQPTVIDLAALRSGLIPDPPPAPPRPDGVAAAPAEAGVAEGGEIRRRTQVMLFADVKNFSKLDDDRYPDFFQAFLKEVKAVIDASRPRFKNTWGDGLYVVFDTPTQGAEFAMSLLEKVEEVPWEERGLPAETTVRIGLHAGPVYQGWDPIIEQNNYFGSQVNRAARIEPATLPGCAFASEQFAAALAVEPGHEFACEYVGVEDLAKGYDRVPLYRVGRL
jgi:class 3 adenylate cyclase